MANPSKFSVYIGADAARLRAQLQAVAEQKQRSVSYIMRKAIAQYLDAAETGEEA